MALLPANASQITDQNKLKGSSKATFLANLFSVLSSKTSLVKEQKNTYLVLQ